MTVFYELDNNITPIGDARNFNEVYTEIKKFCNKQNIDYFYLRECEKGNRHYIIPGKTRDESYGAFYYLLK